MIHVHDSGWVIDIRKFTNTEANDKLTKIKEASTLAKSIREALDYKAKREPANERKNSLRSSKKAKNQNSEGLDDESSEHSNEESNEVSNEEKNVVKNEKVERKEKNESKKSELDKWIYVVYIYIFEKKD